MLLKLFLEVETVYSVGEKEEYSVGVETGGCLGEAAVKEVYSEGVTVKVGSSGAVEVMMKVDSLAAEEVMMTGHSMA